MKPLKIILFLFALILSGFLSAQEDDSLELHHWHEHDTFYIVHENVGKHKFLGNCWYTGAAYTFSKSNEFSFNVGRSYGIYFGSGGGFNIMTMSYGIGYSYYQKHEVNGQTISAFAEYSNFFVPPVTARVDYIYDIGEQTSYVRPSVGLSFFVFDLLYNYSFRLNGTTNAFKHGVTIRLKYYLNNKKWEKRYPNRC